MKEVWKPIPGYPYEVSNLGRVRRSVAYRSTKKDRVLAPRSGKDGRRSITLWHKDKTKKFTVARLMLLAFVGPPPGDKYEAAHADDKPANDSLTNIYWATKAQNTADRDRNGKTARGSQNGNSIFSTAQVLRIRRLRKKGLSLYKIAKRFEVSRQTIGYICNKGWKHL